MIERKFIGMKSKEGIPFQIPKGEIVTVIKYYSRRRALVEYNGQKYLTFSTLLRRIYDRKNH